MSSTVHTKPYTLQPCSLVINPLQTLIMPVVKDKLYIWVGVFYGMLEHKTHLYQRPNRFSPDRSVRLHDRVSLPVHVHR